MPTNARHGNDFLLRVATTSDGDEYITVGALRATNIAFNKAVVDITNKDASGWSEIMPGGGVKSASISASGIYTNDPSKALLMKAFLAADSAQGSILFATNPSDGETVILNGVTWTFVAAPTATNETVIQADLEDTLAQLVIDLNASVNASLSVATYSADATTLTIIYDSIGKTGNAYTLGAGTSGGTVSAPTLRGGGDNDIHWNMQLQHYTGRVWEGTWNVDSYAYTGDHNVEQTYEITLSSTGVISYT